jgi:hypothetical protein
MPSSMFQRGLDQVELLVLIHDLLGEAEAVERLALEAEHGLRVHVAALGDAAAGAVALGDEEGALLPAVVLLGIIAEVDAAVAQFLVVQAGLLRALAGQLADAAELLALALVLQDARLEHLATVGCLCRKLSSSRPMKSPTKLRMLCPPGSTSKEPSLVLVWLSNTGSITFTLTAATMPVRTSPASQSFLKNSLMVLATASRKAPWCVPPWVVCWPFTKL